MKDTEPEVNNYQGLRTIHLKKQTKPKAIHLNEEKKTPELRCGDEQKSHRMI